MLILLIVGYLWYTGQVKLPGQVQPTPTPTPTPGNLIDVNRQVKFTFIDKYTGQAGSGTAYLYASDGKTLLESGSISSGAWTTSSSYSSGTILYLKYVNGNTILWKQITVPQMRPSDAESVSTNPVKVEVFTLCSLTDALQDSSGNSYADNAIWNKTSGGSNKPGVAVATATYSVYVSADNTGYMSSYDPIYGQNFKAWLVVKVSGTGYENVILKGFTYAYEKGTSMYYWYEVPDTGITKWKVGNEYVYPGAWSFAWTVDLTGYSSDTATMQISLYAYASPQYHQTYGSFGPYSIELAEQTITLGS